MSEDVISYRPITSETAQPSTYCRGRYLQCSLPCSVQARHSAQARHRVEEVHAEDHEDDALCLVVDAG